MVPSNPLWAPDLAPDLSPVASSRKPKRLLQPLMARYFVLVREGAIADAVGAFT